MKTGSYTVQTIEPSEGFYLTQNKDVPEVERIISKKVFLSNVDSIDNWKEISEEEASRIKKIQNKVPEEDIKQFKDFNKIADENKKIDISNL